MWTDGRMTQEQREKHDRMVDELPTKTRVDELMRPNAWKRTGKQKRPLLINGVRYPSIHEAASSLGITPPTVHHHLKRRRPGWSYA